MQSEGRGVGVGPTCDLEGDGEEGRDTRLLLSLGLTWCNYRAKDTAISYTHTHRQTDVLPG